MDPVAEVARPLYIVGYAPHSVTSSLSLLTHSLGPSRPTMVSVSHRMRTDRPGGREEGGIHAVVWRDGGSFSGAPLSPAGHTPPHSACFFYAAKLREISLARCVVALCLCGSASLPPARSAAEFVADLLLSGAPLDWMRRGDETPFVLMEPAPSSGQRGDPFSPRRKTRGSICDRPLRGWLVPLTDALDPSTTAPWA